MSTPDLEKEKSRLEQDLKIQRQIAFASGLFQREVTASAFLESLAEGVVVIDNSGTILLVNTRAVQMFGYPATELLGKPHTILIPERLRKVHEDHEARYFQEPRIRPMGQLLELSGRRRDGSEFPVEISLGFIETINGVLVLALVSDMTLRKQFESHLQESEIHNISERKRMEDQLHKTSIQNELILASAGEGIIGLDPEGNQTFVNTSAAAMLGYDVSELVGKQSHSTWHYAWPDGSCYPVEKCPVYAAYKDGTVHSGEEMFLRKDGTGFPVHFSSRPIFSDGKITGAVLTFNDITERKRMEEDLRKSELKLSKIFHSVPAVIAISTLKEGRFIEINEAWLGTFGYQRNEVIGRTSLEIGLWENLSDRVKVVRTIEKHGSLQNFEVRFKGKTGRTLTCLYSAESIDLDGERYLLSLVRDITEWKCAEEEIKRLNASLTARAAELEDANLELEAFNYSVAHDLRNPLNVVSSYCQIIKEFCGNKLDDQCMSYLQETYDTTLRMNRLIEALLNFSHLSHVEPKREKVDLSAMSHEVATELKLAGSERRVTFRIADGIYADGDANLLRIVLANLLGNACKYTATREEAVIEFGATEIDGKTVYFVRDNGCGFNIANADKLFAPFQRLPGAEKCRGFGIGLSTVERIIRRHGGRIWAEGEPDKGATFYFSL